MTPQTKTIIALTVIIVCLVAVDIQAHARINTVETELAESQRHYWIVSNLSLLLERNLQEQIERNIDLEWQLQNNTVG